MADGLAAHTGLAAIAARLRIDPAAIVDAAWVAAVLSGPTSGRPADESRRTTDAEAQKPVRNNLRPNALAANQRSLTGSRANDGRSASESLPETQQLRLHLPRRDVGEVGQLRGGPEVRIATSRTVATGVEIARALRSLTVRWPKGHRPELDLTSTVKEYAETGRLVPRFHPAGEHWFDATLVVDANPSMAVWGDVVADIQRALARLGAFQTLETLSLEFDGKEPQLRDSQKRPVALDRLRSPNQRRLIMVFSDCFAEPWRAAQIWSLLASWGHSTPVVLASPLTPGSLRRNGVGFDAVVARAPSRGACNRDLTFRAPLGTRHLDRRVFTALPVLNLASVPLERWSRMLMRSDPAGCEALLVPTTSESRHWPASVAKDSRMQEDPAELVSRFRRTAAPAAFRLACLCSPQASTPLRVLNVIRREVAPDSTLADVAEVISSGLFTVTRSGDGDTVLSFKRGVQRLLDNFVTESDLWNRYSTLSSYATKSGSTPPLPMTVIVSSPGTDAPFSGERDLFAEAAAATLLLLKEEGLEGTSPGAPHFAAEVPQLQGTELSAWRLRQRLASQSKLKSAMTVPSELRPVIVTHSRFFPSVDPSQLQRAYEHAVEAERFQQITTAEHSRPVQTAQVVAELGLDTATVVAALVFGVYDDEHRGLQELQADFGAEVLGLVYAASSIKKVVRNADDDARIVVRRMAAVAAQDPRSLALAVADSVWDLGHITRLPEDDQRARATEFLDFIGPVAGMLGFNALRSEFEDKAFAVLQREEHGILKHSLENAFPMADTHLADAIDVLARELAHADLRCEVTGRIKGLWSVRQKLRAEGLPLEALTEVMDIVGVRVLCDEVRDCYQAVGVVHHLWQPVAGHFNDFIAQPRFGVYQSLHTTVVGPDHQPVEVQIRTHDMDRTADYGVAAGIFERGALRWTGSSQSNNDEIALIRVIGNWRREQFNPETSLEGLRSGQPQALMFTPRGDVISLPIGSTPVDFAYAIHTEVGHRCIGARVNGGPVELDYRLQGGEVVEVITSRARNAGPSREWLSFVASKRAKQKVTKWFARERRREEIRSGSVEVAAEARRTGIPFQGVVPVDAMAATATAMGFKSVDDLYLAIAQDRISVRQVIRVLVESIG
ncbi:bifunctional (p)ppGpp synthetase/guanosine-3',5'-bis(diphosphate) 3'-pyrophosphohydrolase [Mycolicibacterium fortuitum]|nr:SAV_2336 N-terminal domain-related protein [Mycolicibacterium fortuitum]MCV7143454.1 bifunctional (p)ppGpp synthetase/guanosine-3',5'-bis(diphosphate) 3'-pyrophosphohydrolase [Mycolicibacterium fortuitum]